jgi:uncharacterized delta-60 repeat protein
MKSVFHHFSSVVFIAFCSITNSFSQDGSLDDSYGTDGIVTFGVPGNSVSAESAALQADGKLVVCGYVFNVATYTSDFMLARFNTDGSFDNTFGNNGVVITDIGTSEGLSDLAIQADGKIVVGGNYPGSPSDFVVARYNTNGSLDESFGDNGTVIKNLGGNDQCKSICIQDDGKIVAGGFTIVNNDAKLAVVRLTTNGILDNSFDLDGKAIIDATIYSDYALDMVLNADGKIILAGNKANSSNEDCLTVRLNANGSIDNTFNADGVVWTDFAGTSNSGRALTVQPDGKTITAGYHGNSGDFTLVRYTVNGNLDISFDTDGKKLIDFGSDTIVRAYSTTLQVDGKILVAGNIDNSVNGNADLALARLNSDGSLDSTFGGDGKLIAAIGLGNDFAKSLILQSDSKIIVTGSTLNINGTYDALIVRFNNQDFTGLNESGYVQATVYPNPATSSITMELSTSLTNADCSVYNESGQLVKELNHLNGNTIVVKRDQLPKGNYYARITQGNALIAPIQPFVFD